MKKALVCDWLETYAGAERCVQSFTDIWDDFEVFSLVDYLKFDDRQKILKGKFARTGFIQNLPFAKSKFRSYLPLFSLAIEQFDLSEFDVVLSSSHAVAKGALTHSNQLHISYVHTPMRYAWDMYFDYLRQNGLECGLKAALARYFLYKIRLWDIAAANRADIYVANSNFIARRIRKIYGKDAAVIYPPVDTANFKLNENKEDFYVTVSRMVPYKKIDLIVRAFNESGKKLVVVGDGEQMNEIRNIAKSNIEILGFRGARETAELMSRAKAFVFAAVEDFGIAPVEAQACGTPVICLGKGGAKESVIDGVTGVYFSEQSEASLNEAVVKFEKNSDKFDPQAIRQNALKFSKERFEYEIKGLVEKSYERFLEGKL
ncbi:glycosyltransferase family 4 protein [uncultured Campylobacter sp.]|uniref:glycosyltransferase family 4 protein n=1 Tax=uncultured Campylobacter sp. TaxID=218934 RepID=UPI00260B0C60|nr:glycosyltransferase family 4 protein [uncultured Campylobacter sp.]